MLVNLLYKFFLNIKYKVNQQGQSYSVKTVSIINSFNSDSLQYNNILTRCMLTRYMAVMLPALCQLFFDVCQLSCFPKAIKDINWKIYRQQESKKGERQRKS